VSVVANLILFSSVATAAVCLLVGLLVLVYGYVVEQRIVFVLGTITLLAGLVYQMQFAIDMFNLGSWSSLAALGVAAILIGSTIERHGAKIKTRLNGWSQRFKQWEN
jgi:1,4-dihydroxy-2-naphthoate octaprenyltransferase